MMNEVSVNKNADVDTISRLRFLIHVSKVCRRTVRCSRIIAMNRDRFLIQFFTLFNAFDIRLFSRLFTTSMGDIP